MIKKLQIGDIIVRAKGPLSTHYMVYVGIKNGIHFVAENQNKVGVRITSLTQALAGNTIERIERFRGTETQRRSILPKISRMLGRKYDLIVFNCEHFARSIVHGKVESKQVKIGSSIAMIGGTAMLFSKNSNIQILGIFAIILGFIGRISQR